MDQTIVRIIWIVFRVDITKTNIKELFANGHFWTNQIALSNKLIISPQFIIIGQELILGHSWSFGDLGREFDLFGSFSTSMNNSNFILKYSSLTVWWNWNEINSRVPDFFHRHAQLGCIELRCWPTLTKFQSIKYQIKCHYSAWNCL